MDDLSILQISQSGILQTVEVSNSNGEVTVPSKYNEEAIKFCIILDQMNDLYIDFLDRYFPDRPFWFDD